MKRWREVKRQRGGGERSTEKRVISHHGNLGPQLWLGSGFEHVTCSRNPEHAGKRSSALSSKTGGTTSVFHEGREEKPNS